MSELTLNRRSFVAGSAALIALLACGVSTLSTRAAKAESSDTFTITALNAKGEYDEIEVPYDPQRLAVLDMACLDIIDTLGLGDRVVGIANTTIDYLQPYMDAGLNTLGTVKEADFEAVMETEPDVIFIGGRLSSVYDDLCEIAPVVYVGTDTDLGVIESTSRNATEIAKMFGLEDEIAEILDGYTARIEALQEFADGKTAIVGMCTSGSFNLLGNDGRCSIIGREIGFTNVGIDDDGETVTSTHGNESSYETIVSIDPEYIFVMDRDAAIGTEGARLAQEILENELIMEMDAYKDGKIVYLEHPNVWYTAEGGLKALGIMLEDLEESLGLVVEEPEETEEESEGEEEAE